MIIGIIGLGTVGIGVVDIIAGERAHLEKEIGESIVVKKACARSPRQLATGETVYTNNIAEILEDKEIDTVVELVGGTTIAKDIVMKAIEGGKNVVTANKSLIAQYAKEIFSAAAAKGVNVYFEASICGGTPIIAALKEGLVANHIFELQGIMNGTTNFILSHMETDGYEYNEIYAIADGMGFLESDPNLDIDGIDTAHKLCILAMLSYEKYLPFDQIRVKGISQVQKKDIAIAGNWNYRIKLLANAMTVNNNIAMDVYPTLIYKGDLFANVMNAFNACKFTGNRTGDVVFYGKGAGRYPTASSVVADILKVSRHNKWNMDFEEVTQILPITRSKYYIRVDSGDLDVTTLNLPIEKTYKDKGTTAFITEIIEEEDLSKALENLSYVCMKVK